mgnify:CR=1 FL=1
MTVEDLERFIDYLEAWPSVPASPMRLAVADAMRRSWTRPLATVGLPTLLDRVLALPAVAELRPDARTRRVQTREHTQRTVAQLSQ